MHCMREGATQAAHPNHRGKGMGLKAPDCWVVPLCVECHREFDQGKLWSKLQKRDMMDEWIIQTIAKLAEAGKLKCTP